MTSDPKFVFCVYFVAVIVGYLHNTDNNNWTKRKKWIIQVKNQTRIIKLKSF